MTVGDEFSGGDVLNGEKGRVTKRRRRREMEVPKRGCGRFGAGQEGGSRRGRGIKVDGCGGEHSSAVRMDEGSDTNERVGEGRCWTDV